MASNQYFDFIGTFWDNLPTEDRQRMGELWQGYEQIFASVYQKFVEVDLNISVNDLLSYGTERWLEYKFTSANALVQPPIYTSTQDLSVGVNLATRYLLRFAINNGSPIELDLRGANPLSTTINEIISKINAAAGFAFARGIFQDSIIQLAGATSGPGASIEILVPSDPAKDATEFVLGLQTSELPATYPKFPYVYSLPYPKTVDIPALQDHIRDESVTVSMVSGTDYEVVQSSQTIQFKTLPLATLWARRTSFDDETPWNNFGFLMKIYQPNTPSYLSVVQGLWYAFWTGPKPANLKTALYLLFGLPVAQEDATITAVTATTVETTSQSGIIREFPIPSNLVSLVAVGDFVTKYQPLITGIDVFDKINQPGFITNQIGRVGIQRFLTEEATHGPGDTDETKALTLLEEHTFLPQISVDAFISPSINLGNVKTFLQSIKPLSKTFLFQVIVGAFSEPIAFGESISMSISMDVTPNVDSNQTTFTDIGTLTDYETSENDALNLDSDGVLLQESVEIDVYQGGVLIETIVA